MEPTKPNGRFGSDSVAAGLGGKLSLAPAYFLTFAGVAAAERTSTKSGRSPRFCIASSLSSSEAEQLLEAVVRHGPTNPQYMIEDAYTVRVNGQLERALDLYKKAEKVAANVSDRETAAHWRAAALRGQGYAYTDLQRWDDATKAYQRSLKYEPSNDIARNELQYVEQHRPR